MNNTTATSEDFKNKSLFIGTPAGGGKVNVEYCQSLIGLIQQCNDIGLSYVISHITNESCVPRARNVQIAKFMAMNFSHLIFIDSDIQFDPNDVLKMLYCDRDVLVGAYPLKQLPTKYVVCTKDEKVPLVDGYFHELERAGTGFMMIKRETLLKMMDAYPDLKYDAEPEIMNAHGIFSEEDRTLFNKYTYALMDEDIRMINRSDGYKKSYLSEDYAFSMRWLDLDGKLLLDPNIKLNHIGNFVYKGDVAKIIGD